MIKRHSDLVLEITAYDPETVENDLNTAVEIARDHAMKERRHGILVTQHGYTSYTVRGQRRRSLRTNARAAHTDEPTDVVRRSHLIVGRQLMSPFRHPALLLCPAGSASKLLRRRKPDG